MRNCITKNRTSISFSYVSTPLCRCRLCISMSLWPRHWHHRNTVTIRVLILERNIPILRETAYRTLRKEDIYWEIQLISSFLEWLCSTNGQSSYRQTKALPFIPGWTRPDATWCTHVFGCILFSIGILTTLTLWWQTADTVAGGPPECSRYQSY